VLISIDGKLSDPGDPSDWFCTAVVAVLSQHGALTNHEAMRRGKIGKIQTGKAVTYPPAGYDKGPHGRWELTSDQNVRAAVSAVFRTFLEVRSIKATAIRLRELHLKVPVRPKGRPPALVEPTVQRVYGILSNPNYTQDYHYARSIVDPTKKRTVRGHRRRRKAAADEVMVVSDHHEGYVTREEWQEIRNILRTNAWSPGHTSVGHGRSIAQGLVRCAVHREWRMMVQYNRGPRGGGRSYIYRCEGDAAEGLGERCSLVSGARTDDAVLRAVVGRLAPPRIEELREAVQRLIADKRAELHHREMETVRLRQRVIEMQRKLDILSADSYQSIKHVEKVLEAAACDLLAIEAVDSPGQERMVREYEAILEEALRLAPDISSIVAAPTTTNRDRKELVRMLVRAVLVEAVNRERVLLRIRWNDGVQDTEVAVLLPRGVERLIMGLYLGGETLHNIAAKLNDQGIKTARGNVWGCKSVYDYLRDRRRGVTRKGRVVNVPAAPECPRSSVGKTL
jgi:hypothetical protein